MSAGRSRSVSNLDRAAARLSSAEIAWEVIQRDPSSSPDEEHDAGMELVSAQAAYERAVSASGGADDYLRDLADAA